MSDPVHARHDRGRRFTARHRVLLVEDNPGDADLTRDRLEGDTPGFEVVHVKSLAEAVARVGEGAVDAVVLDLGLPDSQGLATLLRMRASAGHVPIVVVSGGADEALRPQLIERGADEALSKEESSSRLFSRSVLYVIEHAKAREHQRQIEALLAATPDAILVVNLDGVVRYLNEAALRLFDRRREDFIGERLGFSVTDGEPHEIVIRGRVERYCEMRVVPLEWCGEDAYLGALRDMTALKVSQRRALEEKRRALRRAHELRQLLDQIAGLALQFGLVDVDSGAAPLLDAQLDEPITEEAIAGALAPFEAAFRGYVEANDQLRATVDALARSKAATEAANLELESFSYSVAHDLRAPLRSIDGFSHMLLEEGQDRLDELGKQYLRRICAATRRMSALIQGLLELAHVNRTEMRRSEVDVSRLACEIADRLREEHPGRELAFQIALGLRAHADPRFLEVVLENLLGNAVKFTSRRREARVEVGALEGPDETIFYVRDNGAGFEPAHAEKLFGVFQRLHAEAEFVGTGIGLNIVKRVVLRHGGRVWADGAREQGATFFFTLEPGRGGGG